ncbi:MAG TPA: glycosyltransferase [Chloroflexota bacterium]|nr:glycosyltransferase [Chloroflexota bacterium]
MRILIVSKALISAAYRQKLVELARLGVEVHAAVPPNWREAGRDQPLEPGADGGHSLTVTPIRFNGHFHLHYYPKLPEIVDRVHPDLIHLDEEPHNLATYLGVCVADRRGIPAVFFTWQNIPHRYPPPFRELERRVYRSSAGALAGNGDASAILRRKGYAKRVAVIPQFGVDPDAFAPAPRDRSGFTIGFLNRLIPAKGPAIVLDAFGSLPPTSRLRIVGDGPCTAAIREEICRRGWDSRVTIEPRVASVRMPRLLKQMDVVVLPSISTRHWKEQFGRILVEAMACGIPVVGSNSGEIPNVIGDAGLVVPEGDADALAAALARLHGTPALRADLAARGRARVLARFTHAEIARATRTYYERVLRDYYAFAPCQASDLPIH